jgi:hypothetical protein
MAFYLTTKEQRTRRIGFFFSSVFSASEACCHFAPPIAVKMLFCWGMVSHTPLALAYGGFFFYGEMRGNNEENGTNPKQIEAILEKLYIPRLQHANDAEDFSQHGKVDNALHNLRLHT